MSGRISTLTIRHYLTLALLMLRVLTDDPYDTLAMNDLALIADLLD